MGGRLGAKDSDVICYAVKAADPVRTAATAHASWLQDIIGQSASLVEAPQALHQYLLVEYHHRQATVGYTSCQSLQ